MQLHALNFELTGDELFALAVLPKSNEHVSLKTITLKRDDIQVDAVITGLGKTESHWLPAADDGRLRLTLTSFSGGVVAAMMKKSLVVSLIVKAAGAQSGLAADGESMLIDTAQLFSRVGLKGRLTLETIACTAKGLRLSLSGTAQIGKAAK